MTPAVEILVAQARAARRSGDPAGAADLYRSAARTAREDQDEAGLALALRHVADLAREAGDADQSRQAALEAVAAYRRLQPPDPLGLANALRLQALAQPDGADTLWREARDLYREQGVAEGVAECEARLAEP